MAQVKAPRLNPALMEQVDEAIESSPSDDVLFDEVNRRRLIRQGKHAVYQREFFNNRYGR